MFRPIEPIGVYSRLALILLRKEVIQPQVPLRLPCYDFIPVTAHTLGDCLQLLGWLIYFGYKQLP
jgi:hypothetical protein